MSLLEGEYPSNAPEASDEAYEAAFRATKTLARGAVVELTGLRT